jgi:predicted RNase H-like HicB family nuclease
MRLRAFIAESKSITAEYTYLMAKYIAIFEQGADGTWGGYFPDVPTILVNGTTLEEAQENARTGLEFWMEEYPKQE